MKRTYLSLFMAVVLLVSLVPAGALGAVGCIQCRPGDVIYAVFTLAEGSEWADGVMGRLSYPLDLFSVLPSADLIGLDGFSILNRRPAVIAFQVNRYTPAGEYTIEASVVEAMDADGTRHENVRIEPVRVVVESAAAKEEAAAEKARLEQRLAEVEAALTEAEAARTEAEAERAAARTELQNVREELGSLRDQNTNLQNQVETLTAEKNENEYRQAEALYAARDYEGAKALYQKLNGYRDAANKAKACEEAIAARNTIQPGKYVTFGRYPQTKAGNDHTPIEWLVLEVKDNKALLLSRYGLDTQSYNKDLKKVTWETCTLRSWLNKEFLNKAFTAEEQKGILSTAVNNSKSQGYSGYSADSGKNTQDKIFLLSYREVNKYLGVTKENSSNMKSRTSPTAYAVQMGAYTLGRNKTADGAAAGWWWLRSPGYDQSYAADVRTDGSLNYGNVSSDRGCVRPALWVDLDSGLFGF